jgi:hypothetical protein
MNSQVDVLVDSTFLLPTLGVKVTQISDSDLHELSILRPKLRYLCLYQSLVEILGKVGRLMPAGNEILLTIDAGLRSLFDSGVYNWISPTVTAMVEALQIRRKGHRDMIDNLLYATASDRGIVLLCLDRELTTFLNENGYSTENIIDIKKLKKMVS